MEEQEEESVNENSQLGKLIVRTNKLVDRPVIDNSLGEILDVLLRNVTQGFSNSHINPIAKFSFPEAALLLKACANFYSKRVDLLWITINECQKRMVSFESEENKIERQRLEEREQKYKRKRRKIVELPDNNETQRKRTENFGVDWDEIANFQPTNFEKNPKLFVDWCKKMDVNRDLQLVDRAYRSRPEKCCHFRSAEDVITDKDQDDELVVHTSKMESVIALDELFSNRNESGDDFSIELLVESRLKQHFLAQRQLRHEDLEKYALEFEKFVSSYKEDYVGRLNRLKSSKSDALRQKLRRISVASTVVSKLTRSDVDRIFCQTCQVNVPRLSIDQLSSLSRLSVDEIIGCSGVCYNNMGNFQESKTSLHVQPCQVHVNRLSIDDLSKFSGSIIDEVKLIPPDTANVNDSNTSMLEIEKEIEAHVDGCVVAQTNDVDDNVDMQPELDDVPDNVQNQPDNILENNEIAENVLNQTHDEVVKVTRQKRNCDKLNDDNDRLPRKKRKLSKAALRKLATGVTVDMGEFDSFYSTHYQAQDGEGAVEVMEFELGEPLFNSSFIDDADDSEDELPLSELIKRNSLAKDSGISSQVSAAFIQATQAEDGATTSQMIDGNNQDEGVCMEDDGAEPELSIHETVCIADKTADSGILTDVPDSGFQSLTSPLEEHEDDAAVSALNIDETPLYQRVHEWKRYMQSVFKNKKSAVFDIHEYGANIMENLKMGEPLKFADIVKGKSAADVTRFFMSTLQLANTMNVEIQGAQTGRLSNDTFALNLITKERYYDRLDDYMAPSEEYEQETRRNMKKRANNGEYLGYKRYKNR